MLLNAPVRVALLGCGRIAHVHAGYLRSLPGVRLVGACDAAAEAREAFTRRWALPTCASVREMLGALEPQIVHVLTPPHTHASLAIELMRAGVDVFVEKPMALSVADADAMIAVARETGRTLTVDHNRWFDPVVLRARAALQSGILGELVGVDVFASFGEADTGQQSWKQALPGGPIFDTAPHPAYLVHGFVGKAKRVGVLAQRGEDGAVAELRAVIEAERGLATLTMSRGARPFANTVTLLGTKQTALINLNNMTVVFRRLPRLPKLVAKVFPNLDEARQLIAATVANTLAFVVGRQRFYPGIGLHLRAFYAAYQNGGELPVTPEDGRAVVELLQQLLGGQMQHSTTRGSEEAAA